MQVVYHSKRDFGHPKGQLETRAEYNARFGQEPVELPDVPFSAGHVYEWFWELSARRTHGANGPNPLTYHEVALWSQVSGNDARAEEVRMIMAMDAAWLTAVADEQRRDSLRKSGMSKLQAQNKRRFAR